MNEYNPGYWKRKKAKKTSPLSNDALQDTLPLKTTTGKGFSSVLIQNALQDSLSSKTLVIIDVDPQLNETALQDIIDITDQGAIKLVPDVLIRLMDLKKRGQHGQTIFLPGAL